jgi:hypothetical protein
MNIKIPQRLLLLGIVILIILMAKDHFIHGIHPNVIADTNSLCIALGVVVISASIFLSFYGFCTAAVSNRKFLLLCFLGSALLFLTFYYYYELYSVTNRSLDKLESVNDHNLLPDLVERTRIDNSSERREHWAQAAYVLYGVRLSYRRDGNDWKYYVPTTAEQLCYENVTSIDLSARRLRPTSWGLLNGAVDVVWSTFLTFLCGLLWLTVKKPAA